MARADLIIKLIRAGAQGNTEALRQVALGLAAEERRKQHHVLADRVEKALEAAAPNTPRHFAYRPTGNKAEQFLLTVNPERGLNDVLLTDANQKMVSQLLEEHQRRDLLRSYNLPPRHKVLLAGAPGNGKTSLAEAMAYELMVPLHIVRYDAIIGSYLGETASRLRQLFEHVQGQPCVLFFDEFDAIGKERGDVHETGEIKRVVNSLLMQIDRVPDHVLVIGATNHPELLDRAVWRRFQLKMELDMPTPKMIAAWLTLFEKKVRFPLQTPPTKLAQKLKGLSFAEVEEFVVDIQRRYVLSLPEGDMQQTIKECLDDLSHKFSLTHEQPVSLFLEQ